ncbi:MAG: FAD-dependent monooxygenase [Bryobacteraceae bacterium]|nr:FAD-dependent monooxygenase [Bryobacteraceae bacterium]
MLPIVIAGAGIGGLTLAVALARRGLEAEVWERAPVIEPLGAGLLLAPNATRILRELGLLEEALDTGRAVNRWRLLDQRGRALQEIRVPATTPGISIHRADLQRLLLRYVPHVHLGDAVAGYSPAADEVSITFASGQTRRGRALIGADGIHSVVAGAGEPVYRGYVGWRGIAPIMPDGYGGSLSESWGAGGRFGIAPIDQHRTYWYATANRPAGWTHPAHERQADLLRWFGHWHSPIAEVIESTPSAHILASHIADRPPRRGWSQGRVTLLGDAAHPMTPNLGQGACSAIEDAYVLAEEFAHGGPVAEVLQRYERRRYSRTAGLQRKSLWLGRLIQLESAWMRSLRDVALRATPQRMSNWQFASIFEAKL